MATVFFNSEIAKEVGVNAAIIHEKIRHFCSVARLNKNNYKYHNGYYWTYQSRKAWLQQFPFLTDEQIKKAVIVLKQKGFILTNNFNQNKYDRTLWYTTVKEVGEAPIVSVDPMQEPDSTQSVGSPEPINWLSRPNQLGPQNQPIPNESTNESTNESYIYNAQSPKRRPSEFDFDSLYLKYPRKEGKSRGLKICATQVKTQEDFEKLSRAIDNYSGYCASKVKDPKFIKHFSSFMSEWRDWIEYQSNNTQDMTPEQFAKWLGVDDAT